MNRTALTVTLLHISMTPILVSRFFLDLHDLTSYSGTDESYWDVPKMSALANSLSLQFVDPGSTVSVCDVLPLSSCLRLSPTLSQIREYARTALTFSDCRLEDSDPALSEAGGRLASTR